MNVKKFLAALAAFFGVLSAALADGHMDPAEISAVICAGVGAVLVYVVKNRSTP